MLPTVSVIIPAYNAEKTIKQCIEGILNQTYKNIEIIVIDDGSTDNTLNIARTFDCKLIKLDKNMRTSNAMNLGLKAASGDYIYILGSDCVPKNDCLEHLLNGLYKSEEIGLVGGTCITPSCITNILNLAHDVTERYKDFKNLDETYLKYISGANLCIKKEVIDRIGLFNENFITHEDFDFTYRATRSGFKLLFQPKAVSYHYHQRKNLKSYLNRAFKGGQFGTIFRLKYKPSLPYSNYYPNSIILFSLILPFFIGFSIFRIIKKNIGARPIKVILITFPFVCIGQIFWGLGCLSGAYKFKKEIELWRE